MEHIMIRKLILAGGAAFLAKKLIDAGERDKAEKARPRALLAGPVASNPVHTPVPTNEPVLQ
jgi:hypothetical protein